MSQQGDPLGPLLYCNTIHPLPTSLDSVLRLGYMDDFTLGGPQDVVAKDGQSVLNLGHAVGLNLNIAKCEIITYPDGVVTDPTLLSFMHMQSSDAELLGLHFFRIFFGCSMDKAM